MHSWPSTTSAPVAGLSVGRGSMSLTCLLLAGPHLCSVCVSSFGMMSFHGDLAHTDRWSVWLIPKKCCGSLLCSQGARVAAAAHLLQAIERLLTFHPSVLAGPCASIRKASNDSSRIT